MPFPVACQCGKQFMAKDELAGKRVRCPSCSGVLTIPFPQQQQVDLGFNAAPMQAPAQPAQQGFGFPASAPQPSAPTGWQGQPSWQTAAHPQQKKGGISKGLIVGLAVGGGVLIVALLAVVAAVVILMPGAGDTTVANTTPDASAGASPTVTISTGATPVQSDSTAIETSSTDSPNQGTMADSTTTVSTAPGSTTSNPVTTDSISTTSSPSISPDLGNTATNPPTNSSGNRNTGRPTETPVPRPSDTSLAVGVNQWQKQSGIGLRGARRIDDKEDLVILHYSWMCDLLPFVGHQDVYDKFDFKRPWMQDPNRTFATAIIPEYLNPADRREQRWAGLGYQYGMGVTHFAGMSGIETRNEVAATLSRSDPRAGVFGYDQIAKPSEITDGQSQTIMIIGTGEFANPWIQAGGGTIRGAREPLFDETTGLGSLGLSEKGSFAVMADGSVRFISAEIDPTAFNAMCTIHGGENVDQSNLGPALNGFSLP